MRFFVASALALALLLAGCTPQKFIQGPVGKMPESFQTEMGPGAALLVMGPGISIVHAESLPVRHPVTARGKTEFVAQAWDGMGMAEVFVEVLSGGHIRSVTGRESTLLVAKASTDPLDTENEFLTLEGRFVLEAGAEKMLVRAGGVNVAGEKVHTAKLEIRLAEGEGNAGEANVWPSNETTALCMGSGGEMREWRENAPSDRGECYTFSLRNGDLRPTDRLTPFEEWELDLREGCFREKITRIRNLSPVRLNVSVGVFTTTLEPGAATETVRGEHFGNYYLIVSGSGTAAEEVELEICVE